MNQGMPGGGPASLQAVPPDRLHEALNGRGVVIDLGAFRLRLHSRLWSTVDFLHAVYPHFPFDTDGSFTDTTIELRAAKGFRAWLKPLCHVEVDGIDPFGPFPASQLLPHFEWGVNWAFAKMMNAHLLLHAGTVEIGGKGILLIAKPGSGKSTLTAGLVGRGARLLSDEFGVVRTDDAMLLPIAKPIALKNQSIDALRDWWPGAQIGPSFNNTRKGLLAHQAVPTASLARIHEAARPRFVIFPQYREGAVHRLEQVGHTSAFMELAANSFNYELLGLRGFEAACRVVEQCTCYRFEYGGMQEAVDTVFDLCQAPATVQA